MPVVHGAVLDAEPQLQPQGGQTPPGRPRRTAVGTDEPEKRPCRYCGHKQADHLGPRCNGGLVGNNSVGGFPTPPQRVCICTTYAPKVGK